MDKNRGISQLLLNEQNNLTPSEAKIMQALLADYPLSGLGTQANLAKKAGVSDPTVVRFVTKLGFKGFPDFQAGLLEEVEAKLRSPLMMAGTKTKAKQASSLAKGYLQSVLHVLDDVEKAATDQPYERAIQMIMEAKTVSLVGGRFSRHVADMLAGYIVQFRSSVFRFGELSIESFDRLVDLSKRDVVIIFDYRRYQTDVVEFARQVAGTGARIILFTDAWLSPIAEVAEILIAGRVEVDSPFDTLVTSVAQMETLVAHIVAKEGDTMHKRAGALEAIRGANRATVAARDEPTNVGPKRPRPRKHQK